MPHMIRILEAVARHRMNFPNAGKEHPLSLRVCAALHRHGRECSLPYGKTLYFFGPREWSAARRKARIGLQHRYSYALLDGDGGVLTTGTLPVPPEAMYGTPEMVRNTGESHGV